MGKDVEPIQRDMLNFNRVTALVMGILGLTGIVAGIATKTPHNIVIGVVCILLMLAWK